jgi:DNA polymerase-1
MPKSFFLIDGHSHLYQAFYAIKNLTSPQGEPINAVYGFTAMIRKLLREKQPDYIAVVFDSRGPTFRHQEFEDYKATRKPMPEDMAPQIPLIKEVLEALGIAVFAKQGFEADDIIGTLAKRAEKQGLETLIVTRDKDVDQLLSPLVKKYDSKADRVYGIKALREEKRIEPKQVIDMMALAGDTSDNVPGVPGIGPKTALELVRQFGDLEGVLSNIDEISGEKRRQMLKEFAEQARKCLSLVRIDTEVPLEVDFEKCRLKGRDDERLKTLFRRLGFRKFLSEIYEEPVLFPPEEKAYYHLVDTPDFFRKFLAQLKKCEAFSFDIETTGPAPLEAEIVGISFSWKEGEAHYLPVMAPAGEKHLNLEEVLSGLSPILGDEKIPKYGQNIKYDLLVLRNYEVEVKGVAFDTMVASYLIDPGKRRHNLDDLAKEYLGHKMIPLSDLIGEKKAGSLAEVSAQRVAEYSGEDAETVFRLVGEMRPRLEKLELATLLAEVEMPLVEVLAEMEWNGVAIDSQILARMSEKMGQQMAELRQKIYAEAGEEFNIDSTQQLGHILFDKLGLPKLKRTKTTYSTEASVLERLAPLHTLPGLVLEYRALSKLKSTYIDALPRMVSARTGRIHASFNQTVTATGRLSSSDPNLQNIPIRTALGRKIRQAFVPGEEGACLLTADYSQIELRILAHLSQDQALFAAFKRGEDIHAFVASEVFGVAANEVTPEMRRRAKAVNFGVIYGQSPFGLARALGISQEEAAQFIDDYFKRYPGVERFLENLLKQAQDAGFVTTMLKRRRFISGIKNIKGRNRNLAERTAINTVCQGSAADLIKQAMNNIHKRIKTEGRPSRMILQIHDELVFEMPEEAVEEERKMIEKEMAEALPLSVPVKVNVAVGKNWLEAG